MGYDLIALRSGEGFSANLTGWSRALELAEHCGWEPAGTLPRDGWKGPWHGGYHTNDGQVVWEADAKALADAIERGLPDVPDHECIPGKQSRGIPHHIARRRGRAAALEVLSGRESKAWLRDLAAFLRRSGGVEIW